MATAANTAEFELSPESEQLEQELLAILRPPTGSAAAASTQKRVVTQFFVNRIFKVDDVKSAVDLDFYLKVNWIDEKYVGVSDDDFQDNDKKFTEGWWEPGVEVINTISLEKLTPHDEAFWVESPRHGILAYTQRYVGRIATPMDLHRFPFDDQEIAVVFESFHWKAEDMVMFRLPRAAYQARPPPGATWHNLGDGVRLSDWDIVSVEAVERENTYAFEDRTYAQIVAKIRIQRRYGYYLSRVIGILSLVTLMSWCVFFFELDDLANRANVAITLFLTTAAFNFVVAFSLPRVSYLTHMDQFILVCYAYNVFTIVESVVVYRLSLTPELQDAAQLLDYIALGAVPGTFVLYTVLFLLWGAIPGWTLLRFVDAQSRQHASGHAKAD